MPRKCKHALASTMPWPTGGATSFQDSLDVAGRPIRWCTHCGVRLPLGPSNETDERVAVELAAASLAQSWAYNDHKPGYDRFDWCPDKRGELCSLCEQRYLARCIVEHEDGES